MGETKNNEDPRILMEFRHDGFTYTLKKGFNFSFESRHTYYLSRLGRDGNTFIQLRINKPQAYILTEEGTYAQAEVLAKTAEGIMSHYNRDSFMSYTVWTGKTWVMLTNSISRRARNA